MRPGLLVTAGLSLGVGLGCPGLSAYTCQADADCDRDGASGVCLSDGACAYPDPDGRCDSGWVRSPNAAADPGGCAPAPADESTSTGGETETETDGASGVLETGGEPPSCGTMATIEVDTAFLSASEVLEGYPLLLLLSSPAIAAGIEASGEDPVVVAPGELSLPSEVDAIDLAAGTLALWVRLPAYELGEPLRLSLRWGGSSSPAGDVAEVWAGTYLGVWHLGDALSGIDGDELRNSANVAEPGRTSGQMQPDQSVPGVVGRALSFDGEDDIVTIDAQFVGQLESYSISLWVRYDGAADGPGDYFQRLNGDYFYPRCWRIASGSVFCQYILDDTVNALGTGMEQDVGQLLHLAMTRDADTAVHRLYFDGELVNENDDPPGAVLPDDGYPFELGHGELGTLPGMLDEVRVADRALPASWVRADYRTQLQPEAALASVGAPQPMPCPG
ncbi:MAG: LamG domain-containing protein [Nannocystaceae bacterium]